MCEVQAISGPAEAKLHWSGLYPYLYPSAYFSIRAEARGMLSHEFDALRWLLRPFYGPKYLVFALVPGMPELWFVTCPHA